MSLTIKDIARAAGVAPSTVSRALSDHPSIPAETATRIKHLASELGYLPSAVARGLKTNRSRALGVIVSRIDDPFLSEILQSVEDVVQQAGYSLFVAATDRDFAREWAIVQAMGERRVDGLIVFSPNLSQQHARQLQRYGIPVVAIDNQSFEEYQFSVYHDHFYGSCQLTQHMIDLGHRKIAYLGNVRSGRATQERLNGYRHTMAQAGYQVTDREIFHGPNGRLDVGVIGAHYFLELPERPTAIVCFNDLMAVGMMHTLQQAGVCVPDDCSVVGFDDIRYAAYTNPPLTTFAQPKYQLGQQAAQILMTLLGSADTKTNTFTPSARVLRGTLMIRSSTAPPRTPGSHQVV